MTAHALLVEDNINIRTVIATHLRDANLQVSEAGVAVDATRLAGKQAFDVAILDISLPDGNGLDICRKLRSQSHYTPVIMLSARESETDRVLGLEVGADDYVTKPFSIIELIARVKAQLRRSDAQNDDANGNPDLIGCNNLVIDTRAHEVTVRGAVATLTALEFDLLTWFACNPGQVFNRAQLLDNVWGRGHEGYEHTVNSNINRLRGKIEVDPADPQYIKTVWGVGYCFHAH